MISLFQSKACEAMSSNWFALVRDEGIPPFLVPDFRVVVNASQHNVVLQARMGHKTLGNANSTLTIQCHLIGIGVKQSTVVSRFRPVRCLLCETFAVVLEASRVKSESERSVPGATNNVRSSSSENCLRRGLGMAIRSFSSMTRE